jgi:anaerobic magnesium-protoporphyrin IX monomethyl ester cyclase
MPRSTYDIISLVRAIIVNFPVGRISNEPGLRPVMRHLGVMPNLSLLYVASVMRNAGVEVDFVEMEGLGLSLESLRARVKRARPDIACFTIYTSHFHEARQHAEFFKQLGVKVMVGGVHATLFPELTMRAIKEIDFLVAGEAEVVLPEALEKLALGENAAGLPGFWTRNEGRIEKGSPAPLLEDLDTSPLPARDLVPNEIYSNFISRAQNYTVMNTSRGCPHSCVFCEAARKKWRRRSAESVVAEFEHCLTHHSIREIDIFDSSFPVDRKRVLEVCRLLKSKGLQKEMIWDIRSRIDSMDEELLIELREAGCYRVFFGIESGDDDILDNLHKSVKRRKVEEVVQLANKIGISTFGYFLVGSPGETRASHRRTLLFAKSLPLDFCIFNKLTAFPETELYREHYVKNTGRDFWRDYMLTRRAGDAKMERPWTCLTDKELDAMAYGAMVEFYFRPSQIARTLAGLSSTGQLVRFTKAALDMVLEPVRTRLRS